MARRGTFRLPTSDGAAELVGMVQGDGPPLLVQAPGWGCGGQLYQETLRPLARHFQLITYDPRGSGLSVCDGAGLNIGRQAEDLREVMDGLGLDRAHLLGHSHGGWIALRFAAMVPARLTRLVLVGSMMDHVPGFEKSQQAFIEGLLDHPDRGTAARAMRHHQRTGFREVDSDAALVRWFESVLPVYAHDPVRLRAAFAALDLPPFRLQTFRQLALSNAHHPVSADLPRIRVPALVVTGDGEFAGIRLLARRLAADLPLAEILEVTEAGHFPWLERPAPFFAGVARFLGVRGDEGGPGT